MSSEREHPSSGPVTTQVIRNLVGRADETSEHLTNALFATAFSQVTLVENAQLVSDTS